MKLNSVLATLAGLAIAAEANAVHYRSGASELVRRQNRFGGGNRGGGNNGGNGGNNGGNNGGQQGGNNGGQQAGNGGNGGNNGGNNGGQAANTCLEASALQTGSASTGQQGNVAADGQANSRT
jgi:transcription initiation factor TFIID subunit 15